MEKRTWSARIEELELKREKTQKKAGQYDAELKKLRKMEADEQRKQRTHKLIVCGAELAALYGKPLELNEVLTVVNFLREQQQLGIFSLGKENSHEVEPRQIQEENRTKYDEDLYNGMFNF